MDKELHCDFYFGDRVPGGALKEMDCSVLSGYKGRLRTKIFREKVIWQKGMLRLLRGDYSHYILSLDKACISELLFLFIARAKGKKTYLWTHGWYGKESRWIIFYKKLIFKPVTGFFLYGEYARGLMLKEGFPPDKLFVIANSLDYDAKLKFRDLSVANPVGEHFKNGLPTLVFVGRLAPGKALDRLVDCCRLLNGEGGRKVNCLMIGGGEMKERLERQVKESGQEGSVWFYGPCYDEVEMASLIKNCDLCVSPGNVGLTAIECLSYGVPVVSHDDFCNQMPEFEAIVPGKTGDFFRKGDVEDMVRVIEKWLADHPKKTEECVSACYEVIDGKYNPHRQIEIFKSVME